MPVFIKTERFKEKTIKLPIEKRKEYIAQHYNWVKILKQSGLIIKSGYLTDKNKKPGAGGLLIFRAENYIEAVKIIKEDPMIKNNLVNWELNEWIEIKAS